MSLLSSIASKKCSGIYRYMDSQKHGLRLLEGQDFFQNTINQD